MNEKVVLFQRGFYEVIHQYQRLCFMTRAKELQVEACEKLKELYENAHKLKLELISQKDEDASNAMLSFEEMITALHKELCMWVALKEDRSDEAWNYLVSAQTSARTALQVHPVGSHLMGYIEHLHILEHTLFPPQKFFSIGMIVKSAKCSICGEEYGECDHIKGRAYMGEHCVRNIEEADVLEGSIVDNPANKRCRIISVTEDGIERDILTWRILKKGQENDQPIETKLAQKQP